MTKQEFLAKVKALYEVGNMSDSDNPKREAWTKPDMAGNACCATLDTMLANMLKCGALTTDEHQEFYDNL